MTEIRYTDALRQAMVDEMEKDSSVFLLGEDIGVYGGAFAVTKGLLDKFGPERIVNTPISEAGFTGLAIGAALMGSRPVIEIMFMDFIALTMDQVLNQAAKVRYVYGKQAKCPIVIRAVSGGGRSYGPTHSQNLEAWFMHIPGVKVVAPSTVEDAYGMMRAAIQDDNPVLFLEHKLLYPQKATCDFRKIKPSLDGAKCLVTGDDLTIISYSYMTVEAFHAVKKLEAQGYSVELIDLRSISPIDEQTIIDSVEKTGRALVVAEDCKTGGVASEIACRIFENVHDYLDAPIKRLTAPDIPISASPVLEKAALPNRHSIAKAAVEVLEY